jgi:hypothetical protein
MVDDSLARPDITTFGIQFGLEALGSACKDFNAMIAKPNVLGSSL